jgi:hypothetical protein
VTDDDDDDDDEDEDDDDERPDRRGIVVVGGVGGLCGRRGGCVPWDYYLSLSAVLVDVGRSGDDWDRILPFTIISYGAHSLIPFSVFIRDELISSGRPASPSVFCGAGSCLGRVKSRD